MRGPKVYSAITAVAADLARTGIGKSQTNAQEQYQFRGIDDVYNRLGPALAANKLCILPRVVERTAVERNGTNGALLMSVSVKTVFALVSAEDGSMHEIESYGEALDGGDKATSKAMAAAFKYAVIQAFCIPVNGSEDADATSHQLRKSDHLPEPVQGWEQWVVDISDVVRVCETGEALDRLQNMNRPLLKAISRERPELYAKLGECIRERRLLISLPPPKVISVKAQGRASSRRAKVKGAAPSNKAETKGGAPSDPAGAKFGANGGEAHA